MTATQPAHTPGPWNLLSDGITHRIGVPGEGIAKISAHGELTGDFKPNAEANARLIASAPTLLAERDRLKAALEAVAQWIDGSDMLDDGEITRVVQNALSTK